MNGTALLHGLEFCPLLYTHFHSNNQHDSKRATVTWKGSTSSWVNVSFTFSCLFSHVSSEIVKVWLTVSQKQMQQNLFNWISNTLEIPIIRYLRRAVPKTEVLAFYQKKKLHQWNRKTSGTCSKRTPRVSVHQPLWFPRTTCSYSTSCFRYEDSRNHRRGPWWHWTNWNNPLTSCAAQV